MTDTPDDRVPDDITVVPAPTADWLNERQLIDYRAERRDCLDWLLAVGKPHDKADGYAKQTVKNRGARMDIFYRWVWEQEGGYTAAITGDQADAFLQHLARKDTSRADKANYQKALQMLLKWRHHQRGADAWEPEIRFTGSDPTTQPRDYLTREERTQIREAALEYGSVPRYNSLSPEERDRWKAYLAQRLGKPKSAIVPDDWERANGWKIPSLVFASLDAGLRPIEVERAVTGWVDIDNSLLRIPKSRVRRPAATGRSVSRIAPRGSSITGSTSAKQTRPTTTPRRSG